MMTTLIDGKKVSSQIRDKISQETAEFIEKTGIQPHLVVIIVGNNPASMTYVRNKKKSCEEVGFKSTVIELPVETTESELLTKIRAAPKIWRRLRLSLSNTQARIMAIITLPLSINATVATLPILSAL